MRWRMSMNPPAGRGLKSVEIRSAHAADAAAIARLYAHHVLHGIATFEEEPPGADEMARRLDAVQARGWPWLVAAREGEVLGYAYCTQLRERSGYRFSCEDSIYIRHDAMGQGIGGALLAALLGAAAGCGFREMFAVIGDSANAGSLALHARHGFARVGLLRGAGFKFGRPVDVVHMQRSLEPASNA